MTVNVDFHADEHTFVSAVKLPNCGAVCVTITKGGSREVNLYFAPEQANRFSEDLAIALHSALAGDARKGARA